MRIGCVKEVKNNEYRVGLTPDAVNEYVKAGHEVIVQNNAGMGSSFNNEDYEKAGAKLVKEAAAVWELADMIIKVKEPIEQEYCFMHEGQIVYTYFHFAASEILTKACLDRNIIAVAYETVTDTYGGLPLLKPMSEVAGSMAPLVGSYFLMKTKGGCGVLPTGVPGVQPANVVVLGGGTVGRCSARVAAGLGCKVTILDTNIRTLTELRTSMPANVFTQFSNDNSIEENIMSADMIIGAVLIPGAKAPKLILKKQLSLLKKGTVIVDVAIDQGGCFETSHPTTHDHPTYDVEGIVHYCVANMPGAYPKTATLSLNNATLPFGLEIANKGICEACKTNEAIRNGLNLYKGRITNSVLANSFDLMSRYNDPMAIFKNQ